MKNVFVIAVLLFISSCKTTTSNRDIVGSIVTWEHKELGVVTLPNKRWSEDRAACKQRFYDKGVLSDGVLIKNIEQIQALEIEYTTWLIVKAGMKKHGLRHKKLPQKLKGIAKIDSEIEACLNGKDWFNRREKLIYAPPQKS